MDEKRKEEEIHELTADEIDDLVFEEQLASGEYDEEVPEYYFSNPDPYAKVEPRPDDAPSVSSLSMKRATSLSRICLPFGCPM